MAEYPWKRFWCPRDGFFRLDREGFLLDPEEEFGSITNRDAKPFEALVGSHFLGLLGEAGSGKTQTLRSEYSRATGPIAETRHISKFVSLRDIGSGTDLDHEIFDANWFMEWRAGDRGLHLFLDALDEASDRYPQIALRMLSRIEDLPLQRLFIRVACRTASWPGTFDGELRGALEKAGLGVDPYLVHELLPLRRKDVELAATTESLDPAHFVEELVQKGVVPLALKPITLRFLMSSYKITRSLPSSSVDLYAAGCRDLSAEASHARRDARDVGALDAEQRLAVAERLAAVTLLCNRQAVWTGLAGDRPNSDATPGDVNGTESLGERRLEVSDSAVLEVIGTGLISARGENRFGWSHHTFGEFLAARYLTRHGFTPRQILSLIIVPDDSAQRVRPQLAGTAAWLASMREDIQLALLDGDPTVLLLSDSATLGAETRRRLVSKLLEKFEKAELLDREGVLFRFYGKLAHPGLSQQVREAVGAPQLSIITKREAIAIARACGLRELSDSFAELALNASTPLELRVTAANAIVTLGDLDTKRRLLPLAHGVSEDADDELKGAALYALWPSVLDVEALPPHLTRRKRPNHYGLYDLFLIRLPEEAADRDIPSLLRWIAGFDESYSGSISFGGLASRIIDRAGAIADIPEVMAELPRALRRVHQLYFEKSDTNWGEPALRRRLLVDHLVQSFESREKAATDWPWNLGVPLAVDFEWLLTRLREDTEERQPIWLELLAHTFRFGDARQANALLETAPFSDRLAAEFEWCLGTVDLTSERAERDRSRWQERLKWEQLRESRKRDGSAELSHLLDLAEDGKLGAWNWVPQALAITQDGKDSSGTPPTDLLITPGWLSADPRTRDRVVRVAAGFLKDFDLKTSEWLGTNTLPHSIFAAMAAFTLVYHESPQDLSTFSTEVWQRWAPAIISFPFFQEKDQTAALVRKAAYRNAPNAVLETLATMVDTDDVRSGWTFATGHVDDFWDDRVANLLITKLQRPGLKDGTFSGLLEKLLEHGNQEANELARDLISRSLPEPGDRQRFISTSVMLFSRDPAATWPLVWPPITAEQGLAREFFVALARGGRPNYAGSLTPLEEKQIAELYIRLSELFPHANDRLVSGFVSPDDEGRMFRDSVLAGLRDRGTQAACDAIAEIGRRMPELSWLKWVLLEAHEAKRRNAPAWPKPADILEIAADRTRRFVRDAADLQAVLLDSLAGLERELQGETPGAPDLWDKKTGSRSLYLPKPEEAISDHAKRYLDRELHARGVIVNREVRIHRGERTDIHVDAVVNGEGRDLDTVTVIIEVKGCWNPELLSATKDQLVGKYLVDNRCRHGIYLQTATRVDPHAPAEKFDLKFDRR